MKGYVVKKMESLSCQFSSILSSNNETTEIDSLLEQAKRENPDIIWEVISYNELEEILASLESREAQFNIALSQKALPYKRALLHRYPNISIVNHD